MKHFYEIEYDSSSPLIPDDNVVCPDVDKGSQDILKTIFSCLDLTSLNTDDTDEKILGFCQSLNQFKSIFTQVPNVAAICVYPPFIPLVHNNLIAEGVQIVSVAAGFPSAQTFPEVKLKEIQMVMASGASEIDIVLPLGLYFSKRYTSVIEEIRMVKHEIGSRTLKVILETGLLKDPAHIWKASLIAMEGGADFIKTSTGKIQPAATPEAFQVMIRAVRKYHDETGRKVGIKPAGGISTTETALKYYHLVNTGLGPDWLTSALFRIGASRLANVLLTDIHPDRAEKQGLIDYF